MAPQGQHKHNIVILIVIYVICEIREIHKSHEAPTILNISRDVSQKQWDINETGTNRNQRKPTETKGTQV